MKQLSKEFILQDDYDSSCFKCGAGQNVIDVPIEQIPKEVILHSLGWCDFRVIQCTKCNQKAIQYIEFEDRYD